MKILTKENAVKFNVIYNERFNCIDFDVYPNDWMADHWLEYANCKKTVDENDRSNHHGLDYYYPIKHDKVSNAYIFNGEDGCGKGLEGRGRPRHVEVLARPAASQNRDLA